MLSILFSVAYGQEQTGELDLAIFGTQDPDIPEFYNLVGYQIIIDGVIPPSGLQKYGEENQTNYKLVESYGFSVDRTQVSLTTLGNLEISSGSVTETGMFHGYFMINKIEEVSDGTTKLYFDKDSSSVLYNDRTWDNCVGGTDLDGADALIQVRCQPR
jgi:hypothetical protein